MAYYVLRNNYKNIITVPKENESRDYCIAFLKDNDILLSIINKSIASIDDTHMNSLIINETTKIDREITIPMIIDAYGKQINGIIFLIMLVLLSSIARNIRAKNQLKIQFERYQILSQTSNEYMYEYYVKTKHLELSKNCIHLLEHIDNIRKIESIFHQAFTNGKNSIQIIEVPIANSKKVFKSINSPIYDDKGRVYSIIGKLIDISEEEAEKQELIKKSELDGLTGLYNASTAKDLVSKSICYANSNEADALILIDCDNFKAINDSYGHLEGDKALVNISKCLTRSFRSTDIIGRIGGDEFCVYMGEIPSTDFVVLKCQEFMTLIKELECNYHITVSMGIALLGDEKTYEDLFIKADSALYEVKKKGGNQIGFYK